MKQYQTKDKNKLQQLVLSTVKQRYKRILKIQLYGKLQAINKTL